MLNLNELIYYVPTVMVGGRAYGTVCHHNYFFREKQIQCDTLSHLHLLGDETVENASRSTLQALASCSSSRYDTSNGVSSNSTLLLAEHVFKTRVDNNPIAQPNAAKTLQFYKQLLRIAGHVARVALCCTTFFTPAHRYPCRRAYSWPRVV